MITYIKGDLFSSKDNLIAHGCNCLGGFGSGVAYQIALQYPKVKEAYLSKYRTENWSLGEIQVVPISETQSIVNCATQFQFYPRNKVHADYSAIQTVFNKLLNLAMENNWTVACPKIGAGLAGGDWSTIETIIEDSFKEYPINIYYL